MAMSTWSPSLSPILMHTPKQSPCTAHHGMKCSGINCFSQSGAPSPSQDPRTRCFLATSMIIDTTLGDCRALSVRRHASHFSVTRSRFQQQECLNTTAGRRRTRSPNNVRHTGHVPACLNQLSRHLAQNRCPHPLKVRMWPFSRGFRQMGQAGSISFFKELLRSGNI